MFGINDQKNYQGNGRIEPAKSQRILTILDVMTAINALSDDVAELRALLERQPAQEKTLKPHTRNYQQRKPAMTAGRHYVLSLLADGKPQASSVIIDALIKAGKTTSVTASYNLLAGMVKAKLLKRPFTGVYQRA